MLASKIHWEVKKKLKQLCNRNNLPTSQEVDDILEGWVGKPKGAVQRVPVRIVVPVLFVITSFDFVKVAVQP